jgi:hypothetical protein
MKFYRLLKNSIQHVLVLLDFWKIHQGNFKQLFSFFLNFRYLIIYAWCLFHHLETEFSKKPWSNYLYRICVQIFNPISLKMSEKSGFKDPCLRQK